MPLPIAQGPRAAEHPPRGEQLASDIIRRLMKSVALGLRSGYTAPPPGPSQPPGNTGSSRRHRGDWGTCAKTMSGGMALQRRRPFTLGLGLMSAILSYPLERSITALFSARYVGTEERSRPERYPARQIAPIAGWWPPSGSFSVTPGYRLPLTPAMDKEQRTPLRANAPPKSDTVRRSSRGGAKTRRC